MKHQHLISFKKYLEASFPNNLSRIYFVIMENDFERLQIIDYITRYLPHDSAYALCKKNAGTFPAASLIRELDAPSLLASRSCLVVDELEQYKKAEVQKLASYLKKISLFNYLVLGARNKKELLTLLNEIDRKGGVVLDLFFENFREKEQRLAALIREKCAQAKKNISREAVLLLLEKTGLDLALIENEVEKVISFAADTNQIKEADVAKITRRQDKSSLWQIAEKIVFAEHISLEKFHVDTAFFHALLSILRYSLQESCKLAAIVQSRRTGADYRSFFPNVRPKTLEKRKEAALKLSGDFFKKGLELLFKIDLMSKSGVDDYAALLTFFQVKLLDYAADYSA